MSNIAASFFLNNVVASYLKKQKLVLSNSAYFEQQMLQP